MQRITIATLVILLIAFVAWVHHDAYVAIMHNSTEGLGLSGMEVGCHLLQFFTALFRRLVLGKFQFVFCCYIIALTALGGVIPELKGISLLDLRYVVLPLTYVATFGLQTFYFLTLELIVHQALKQLT